MQSSLYPHLWIPNDFDACSAARCCVFTKTKFKGVETESICHRLGGPCNLLIDATNAYKQEVDDSIIFFAIQGSTEPVAELRTTEFVLANLAFMDGASLHEEIFKKEKWLLSIVVSRLGVVWQILGRHGTILKGKITV